MLKGPKRPQKAQTIYQKAQTIYQKAQTIYQKALI